MGEFSERVKTHLKFSENEVKDLFFSILVLAIIFAFDDGRKVFSFPLWFGNFLIVLILVAMALLFRVIVQKALALKSGYRMEYRMWIYGLLIGGALTIITGGKFYLIIPGGAFFFHMASERLGQFRYGLNYGTCGWIAGAGSIANMVLGMFAKELMKIFHFTSPILDKLIFINFLMALFMLLPLPPLDGMMSFFGSRLAFILTFGIIFGYVGLYLSQIFSLIWAIVIGIGVWFVYYIAVEKANW